MAAERQSASASGWPAAAAASVASGILPVDKPAGPTSHDIVARARRALGVRRVGHAGTLDPFATGLLLLCVGPATRLAEYLAELPKTYTATARIGQQTDTDDSDGRVVAESDGWRTLTETQVGAAFAEQVGLRMQRPPAFSAKKRGGERMYHRARRGESPDLEPVPVAIHRLRVLEVRMPDVVFQVETGAGAYIRAIARDAGERLGTGAHLTALRRTRIGAFDVRQAVPGQNLDDADAVREAWVAPLDALAHLPGWDAPPEAADRLAHGGSLPAPPGMPADATAVAVATGGRLLAVARIEAGLLRPRKVFSVD